MRIDHRLLFVSLFSAAGSGVLAAGVPKAVITVQANTYGDSEVIHKFGSVTASTSDGHSTEEATAEAARGPNAMVSTVADGYSPDGLGYGSPDNSQSNLQYSFRVVGPAGKVVVDYQTSGSAGVTGGDLVGTAYTAVNIANLFEACAGDQLSCGSAWYGPDFSADGSLKLRANKVYTVTMVAHSDAVGSTHNSTAQAFSYSLVTVDQIQSPGYTIEYSRGFLPN
jgi:hypothetical protein